jgi:hypothetical protein
MLGLPAQYAYTGNQARLERVFSLPMLTPEFVVVGRSPDAAPGEAREWRVLVANVLRVEAIDRLDPFGEHQRRREGAQP